MQPGSVIVDMAAETGGNAAGTKAGETVVTDNGVKIIGPVNLPSEMAPDASALYAKNLSNLLELMTDEEGKLNLNFEDEVVAGACLTHEGEIENERAKEAAGGADGPDDRDHDLRPRRLRRLRGDLEGPDHPAHAADVARPTRSTASSCSAGSSCSATPTTRSRRRSAFIAVAFGTINVVGGFMVTDRMLGMFARKPKPKAPRSRATVTPEEAGEGQ